MDKYFQVFGSYPSFFAANKFMLQLYNATSFMSDAYF